MGADTNLADRVLTVKLNQHGTNVINKQVGTQPANHKHKLFLVIQNSTSIRERPLHASFDKELPKFNQIDPKFRECFMGESEQSS